MTTRQTTKPRAQQRTKAKVDSGALPLVEGGEQLPAETPPPLDASLSKSDRLRVVVDLLKPDAQDALRAQLLESVTQSLAEMDTYDIQVVAQFVDMVEHDHLPTEALLARLVRRHFFCGGLTPDAVVEEVESADEREGFRCAYNDLIENMQRFNATYPRLAGRAPMKTAAAAEDDGK